MRESDVESYLVTRVERIGGMCEKFVSPQRRSVPDRLVTHKGRMFPVELKAPGKAPDEGQLRDHARRLKLGVEVHVLDCREDVDLFIERILRE